MQLSKKLIIFNFFVFTIFFVIFTIILFPAERVAGYYLNKLSNKYSIKIDYDNIEANLTHLTIKNLVVNMAKPLKFKKIEINYSPLFPLNKTITIIADKTTRITVKLTNNNVQAKGIVNLTLLKGFFNQIKGGMCAFVAQLNTKKRQGKALITLKEVALSTKLGSFNLKDTQIHLRLNKNTLTVTKFISAGNVKLKISGRVILDMKNLSLSRLFLTGVIELNGKKQKFMINGTLKRPSIA